MTETAHRPAPDFEITGGALCLDLANTGSSSAGEKLGTFADLLAWAGQAGAWDGETLAALRRRGAADPAGAAAAVAVAQEVRQAIFAACTAVGAGEPVPAAALARLDAALPAALALLGLGPGDGAAAGGLGWRWRPPERLEQVVAPAVVSAARLLASPEAALVRECAAADCRWLFLDRSRNRSRRWCDMASCGNRAKARRHYRRQRPAGG